MTLDFESEPSLGHWQDPNPAPVVNTLSDGTMVVRDDLVPGGTKARALDYLIGHDPQFTSISEWVYGSSPAHGYAQWALARVCERYQKHIHLFMAARSEDRRHRLQRLGMESPAATYHWVSNGMLSVTQKRARDFVAESPQTRALIPIGGNTPSALAALTHVCSHLVLPETPDHIWSVISSGTLSRALQAAFPNATVHGVVVGHTPSEAERGRAQLYTSPYAFHQAVRPADAPPYPSAVEYDAKLWPFYRAWRMENPTARVLIWNVGA